MGFLWELLCNRRESEEVIVLSIYNKTCKGLQNMYMEVKCIAPNLKTIVPVGWSLFIYIYIFWTFATALIYTFSSYGSATRVLMATPIYMSYSLTCVLLEAWYGSDYSTSFGLTNLWNTTLEMTLSFCYDGCSNPHAATRGRSCPISRLVRVCLHLYQTLRPYPFQI